jgi:hypothetical protein
MAEHANTPQARAWWRHYCGIEKRSAPIRPTRVIGVSDELWGRKILSAPVRRGNRVELEISDPELGRRMIQMAYLEVE